MASPIPEAASIGRPTRLKRAAAGIAWIFLCIAIIEFLLIAYEKYGHLDAGAYGMFWSRREWLWAHLAGGGLTIVLGPLQFLTRLRNAFPRFHRWTGRVYLLAMLVGCVGAGALIATSPAGFAIQAAFTATGLAWIFTALMGFVAIRRKLPQRHRRWMIRNYIVTFVFVTFRAATKVPGVMAIASPAVTIPVLLWLSWVVPLIVYEAVVRTTAAMRRARSRAGHPVSSA